MKTAVNVIEWYNEASEMWIICVHGQTIEECRKAHEESTQTPPKQWRERKE